MPAEQNVVDKGYHAFGLFPVESVKRRGPGMAPCVVDCVRGASPPPGGPGPRLGFFVAMFMSSLFPVQGSLCVFPGFACATPFGASLPDGR